MRTRIRAERFVGTAREPRYDRLVWELARHEIGRRRGPRARWLLAIGLLFLQGCGWFRPAEQRPDIILILADALRADYLGCYGFEGDVSPTLDRLAAESIVYDNAIAPAPWTKPSVASLFTSLDPLRHRVVDQAGRFWRTVPASQKTDALPPGAWTLAEALRESGYETAAWVMNPWIDGPEMGFQQGFEHFHGRNGRVRKAHEILPEVREWLEERKGGAGRRPYFLYLHFMDTHDPYQYRRKYVEEFSKSPSLGDDRPLGEDEREGIGYLGAANPFKDPGRGKRLGDWRALYASGVRLFDDHVGPFLRWLRDSGRLDRTVLVFTSDHGEDLLEHGRWRHGYSPTLFQHSIRIPLAIRLPGAKGGGRRDERMAGLLDLMPTLLRLARLPEAKGIDGHALLDSEGRATAAASAWAFSGAAADDPRLMSIQSRDYKLIWQFPGGARSFFDLRHDPGESRNLSASVPGASAADASVAEMERRMARRLSNRVQRLQAGPALLNAPVDLDPDEVERLRALGYLL